MFTVYPVAKLGSRLATISDGFGSPRDGGSRQHLGIDIMFRRVSGDTQPKADGAGSTNYIMPTNHPAIAVGPGKVVASSMTGTGWTVKIDHGGGFVSAYRHLTGSPLTIGQSVNGGDFVGGISHNPSGGADPNHLHFEIYYNGVNVDPEPYVKNLKHIDYSNFLTLALIAGVGILAYKKF